MIARWRSLVQGTIAPENLAPAELVNHLPRFLDELTRVLEGESDPDREPVVDGRRTAVGHGEQRLRLGFSLEAVVREYGALHKAILETATAAGVVPNARDAEVAFDCIIAGIASAVAEYAQQRDAELSRQANEHFAFIAHELRNPLSSAMTAFALLERRGRVPRQDATVMAVERGLRRTRELIEQSLQIARLGSGVTVRREETSLEALLADAGRDVAAEAQERAIDVRTSVERDGAVRLDVRLVASALGNLVRNAVKYSCEGGVVELRGSVGDGRARLEVEDTCGGLPPGKVERAFAPFVRLDENTSGYGLGLAIAKQAADAHGGTIRVQNLPGEGCIFCLDLPAG